VNNLLRTLAIAHLEGDKSALPFAKITKALVSCKTEDQVRSWYNWVDNLKFEDSDKAMLRYAAITTFLRIRNGIMVK